MTEQPGKYAQFELERRFLLGSLPDGVADDRGWSITDRYIKNTHLRLRRMDRIGGGETIFKLGQKRAASPADFSRTTITNIYLSPSEYATLAELDALEIGKLRHAFEHAGRMFSIDVFAGRLLGLILAEVGFETADELAQPFPLPPWAIREVSDDVRFTGGALAGLTAGQAADLLRQLTVA